MVYSKGLLGHVTHSMIPFTKYIIREEHQNFFLHQKTIIGCIFQTGARRGCLEAAPLSRQPTDCRCSETQTSRTYVPSTSSGPAADKLMSKNTTGHLLRTAAERTLSEHTAPSSGLVSVGQGTRPSNGLPYRVR